MDRKKAIEYLESQESMCAQMLDHYRGASDDRDYYRQLFEVYLYAKVLFNRAFKDTTTKEQAHSNEVKHLKDTILTAGFLLADEKAEVARLREALGEAERFIRSTAIDMETRNIRAAAAEGFDKATEISRVLNSKGPADKP